MDNITFKSKIQFVHNIEFSKNKTKGYYIGYTHNVPNILKADKFYTEAIRTCTGGGLVIPQKEAIGFHIWDDKTNKKNFELIKNSMFRWIQNPERGLLIGSKKLIGSPFSIEQFQKFKKSFSEKVPNLTLFEEHANQYSQSHFSYSVKDDTWIIASDYYEPETKKHIVVTSLEALKKAFKTIKIAKGDSLFIGKKEITPQNAPELFEV